MHSKNGVKSGRMVSDLLVSVHEWEVREEVDGEAGPGVVSGPLDDLGCL